MRFKQKRRMVVQRTLLPTVPVMLIPQALDKLRKISFSDSAHTSDFAQICMEEKLVTQLKLRQNEFRDIQLAIDDYQEFIDSIDSNLVILQKNLDLMVKQLQRQSQIPNQVNEDE